MRSLDILKKSDPLESTHIICSQCRFIYFILKVSKGAKKQESIPSSNQSSYKRGPLLAHQQNAIEMAFCWWANIGPVIMMYVREMTTQVRFSITITLMSFFLV